MLPANVATPSSFRDPSAIPPHDSLRPRTGRVRLHPAEKAVLVLVCVHLLFLPWPFGSTRPWPQLVSLGIAIVAFVAALIPRNYTEEYSGNGRFRLIMWPKLVKFPVFWLGLAFLGYISIQALNPAWSFRTDGRLIWLEAIPHLSWLPTGHEGPFAKWNPWRMIVIYGSAWLTVCTIWTAFTRRRTVQLFLLVLVCSGTVVAGFGLAQRLLGNGLMFWFYTSPNPSFFASFIYKNHAGAYLNLMLALAAGFSSWYYLRGLRRMEKSNPSGVFAFCATLIAVAILTSYARGATIMMFGYLTGGIVAFVWHQANAPKENRKPIVAVALVLVFGYFLFNGFDALRHGEAWSRLKQGITRQDTSLELRERVTAVATEMLAENWKFGTGAGSFRYIFPVYQPRDPRLNGLPGQRIFWEYAHNDILQFPIETGVTGTALLLATLLYWLFILTRSYFWLNPFSACVVSGNLLLLVYAWWDFPLQCPAILITWCALWPAVALWTQYEEQNPRT